MAFCRNALNCEYGVGDDPFPAPPGGQEVPDGGEWDWADEQQAGARPIEIGRGVFVGDREGKEAVIN